MTFAEDRASIEAKVTTLLGQAQSYLDNLVNITNSVIVEGTTELPTSYNYASVPQIGFPIYGASGTIGSVSSTPPPAVPVPGITAAVAVTVPEFLSTDLAAPTTTFSFYETAYESALLDAAKAKLLDNMLNGGYGIETADEIALFNRARDREVEAALTRIEEAGRSMASRGFPLPPGELSIYVDRAWQDMQNKVSGMNRDITLERDKLYVENRKFTITETRELEQILIGFHNSVQERAFNVARATVELAVAVYNSQLARFRLWLDAAKTESDVQVAALQLQYEQARTYFDGFRAQIAAYEADVRRQVESVKAQVDLFRANVDNVRVLNDGRIAQAQLQAKVIESTVQQNIMISNLTIENAKTRILGVIETLRFRTGAVKFGSEAFFAQLTALESAVNTLSVQTATA